MKLPLTGGCQCGKLRYDVSEAPRLVYACHCTDCQKMTGSAFSMGAVVAADAFRLTGAEPRVTRKTADSGHVVTRWLCPDCGSWVTAGPRPGAAFRIIRPGTLDDTSALQPGVHLWTRSKQPWITLPAASRQFETQPDDLTQFFAAG